MHNYARYQRNPLTTADTGMFQDVWNKLATQLQNVPGLWGYEIMNEPHDLSGGCSTWEPLAQAAVNGIRQVDNTHYILVSAVVKGFL